VTPDFYHVNTTHTVLDDGIEKATSDILYSAIPKKDITFFF